VISAAEQSFWSRRNCSGQVLHPFSTADSWDHDAGAAVGPSSNTGQKGEGMGSLSRPIIDWCSLTFDSPKAKKLFQKMPMTEVLRYVFGTGSEIACGPLLDRPFNWYERSCTMVDRAGNVCGKIGLANDGRIQISLSGKGCEHVPSFDQVANVVDDLAAKISRLDIAVDDLSGDHFSVADFKRLHAEGAFVNNGRPPKAQFVDDLGSGDGCTLYIGQKGHKQLCVYEKGKQLGDPDSKHVRCELRLYAKRTELVSDALRNPGRYFGGAYEMLAVYVLGEAERLQVKEQCVNASAKAMVRFLRTQAGTALHLAMNAIGGDAAVEFLFEHIVRPGRPGRFKGVSGDLHELVRKQLQAINDENE